MLSIKSFYTEWKIKRHHERFYMVLGVFFLLLALIGVALPIVPQIPFAITSAFFFSKGSPRIHLAIRHNKVFGRAVRDWEDHKVIRPKTKFFSVLAMLGGAVMAHLRFPLNLCYVLDGIFLICILFVLSRKSAPLKLPFLKKQRLQHKAKDILSRSVPR